MAFERPLAAAGTDRSLQLVQAPSAHAGVAAALRSTYKAAGVPADLSRLLARLR